jgi:hypothetical protein
MATGTVHIVESKLNVIEIDSNAISLEIDSRPVVVEIGTSGPQGPAGAAGTPGAAGEVLYSDLSYVHTQSTSSSTWTIVHGLQFIPNITIVDSAGSVVEGDYSYPNENTVVATFSGGFTGKAYLS